jgi:hypothetical protein
MLPWITTKRGARRAALNVTRDKVFDRLSYPFRCRNPMSVK